MDCMTSVTVVCPCYQFSEYETVFLDYFETLINDVDVTVRVVALDDASRDGTHDILASRSSIDAVLSHEENTGYAGAVNDLLRFVWQTYDPTYIAFLNQDARLGPKDLETLVELLEEEKQLGLLQPLVEVRDDSIYSFGHRYNDRYVCHPIQRRRPVRDEIVEGVVPRPSVSLVGTLARTAVFEDVGLLDERYEQYWESSDFGFRVRRHGWQVGATAQATATHHRSLAASSTRQLYYVYRNWVLFWTKFNPAVATEILERYWPASPDAVEVERTTEHITGLDDRSFLTEARRDAVRLRSSMRKHRDWTLEDGYTVPTTVTRS